MRPLRLCLIAALWALAPTEGVAQSSLDRMQAAAEDYRRQDWSTARVKFAQLIAEAPGDPASKAAWFYLGEVESQLKDHTAAKAAYQNFLLLAGEHPHRELARFRLVEIAYLLGNSDSVQLCEGFLQAYPESTWRPEVLSYLGQLRLIRNEPDLAERVFATALEEFPNHPTSDRSRLGLATAQIRIGQSTTARALLEDLAGRSESGQRARATLLLALLDFEAGNKVAARSQLESIVASAELTDAERGEAHVWLARMLAQADEGERALEHYVIALESGLVDPWLSVALQEWSALQIHSGAARSGLDRLRQWKSQPAILRLDRPTRELVAALEVRLSFEAKQYLDTETLIAQYQASFPAGANFRQVLEIAGRTSFARGEFDKGLAYFEELLAHPGNSADEKASYTCQLATLLLARGDYSAARQLLLKEADPQPGLAARVHTQRLLATAELGAGSPAAARRILDDLLDQPEVNSLAQRRPILRQLLEISVREEAFETIRERWPEFATAANLQADDLPLVQQVGDLAYRQADWALATNCYRELAKKEWELTRQAAGWSGLAWTALSEGRNSLARDSFQQLLDLPVPEELKAEAYLPLASLLEQDGEVPSAIGMYQRAITQADDPGVVALAKFKCALRMQQLGGPATLLEARDMLAELESNPASTVPLDQVIYRLAWIDSDSGNEQEAERRYARLLDEFPESKLRPDVAYRLARIRLNRNELDAVSELLAPIDLSSLPVELRERLSFLKAQLATKQGKWAEAQLALATLAGNSEDVELKATATYWQAESCFQLGQWAEAARLFDRALSEPQAQLDRGTRRQAIVRTAEALLAADDWAGSLRAVERARDEWAGEGDEAWPELELIAGRALFAAGRLVESLAAFQKAIDSSPPGAETAAQAQWRIGETWLVQERYAEALEAYLQTVRQYTFPHWRAAALLQAGKCQERLGNLSQAVKIYRQLEQEYPNSEFAAQAQRRIEAVERRARADELIRR